MQIHRTGSSFKRRQTAGQQGRRHTGQYIPAAAPGKARVAGGIHACTAIRRSHNGAGTFEYNHDVPFFCILPGNFLTVGADLCHGKAGEPGHFAGMRRKDQLARRMGQRLPLSQKLRGGIQAISVQHCTARKARQKPLYQYACLRCAGCTLGRTAKARAQQQHCGLLSLNKRDAFR